MLDELTNNKLYLFVYTKNRVFMFKNHIFDSPKDIIKTFFEKRRSLHIIKSTKFPYCDYSTNSISL